MIIDLRTYTVAPGKVAAYLDLYEREGYPIHCRHQGEPLGYYLSEIGTLNQVVHIWKYESMTPTGSPFARRAPKAATWCIKRTGS